MKKALLVIGLGLATATTAHAQEKKQLGLTALVGWGSSGGESSIGLQYHVTERFALRPTFGYARMEQDMGWDSGDYPPPNAGMRPACGESCPIQPVMPDLGQTTSTSWNAGLAGLAYLSKRDGFSSYLGASGAYGRQTSETPIVPMRNGSVRYSMKGHLWTWSGFFGMQYAPAKRFSLFAEAGLRYATSGGDRRVDASSVSTFGAHLGAIFYVK
ncbi:MAG TPA: hypothetical protein VJU18_16585 [Vicinamibacteria bacterium]|nr:hypothetical protein [Vicinamibacteria bacterium]